MDRIKIDDKTLDEMSKYIKANSLKQIEVIEKYQKSIRMLEYRWDSEPFDRLLNKVTEIVDNVKRIELAISQRYGSYYSNKADMIRSRPSFSSQSKKISSISNNVSQSSIRGTKSCFDKVFKKHNENFKNTIYTYLRRINFYVPNEKISFYDPFGASKNGLYDNIMAIDINSESFEDDLLSLTGQHMFFMIDHANKMNIIRCLGEEMNSKSWKNDVAFNDLTKQIIEGKGINYSYLSFDNNDSKYAFNFFTQAFKATLKNDRETIINYNKYYSNSYEQFMKVLHNLSY